MTPPPKFVRRQCCASGDGEIYISDTATACLSTPKDEAVSCILGEVAESPPDERAAWHESAHAVFAHGFSVPIEKIDAGIQAHVRFADVVPLPAAATIAIDYAGHVGEMVLSRSWRTILPDTEEMYLARIQARQGGRCDECKMARKAWSSARREGSESVDIDDARATFREGQLLAIEIGQRQDVRAAIRAVAAALMEQHALSGADAHAIIEQYVKFGELVNAEINPQAA